MEEDRADPAGRCLLSPPGGQGQGQPPARSPSDLYSQFQRRFCPSLFLPPVPPRLLPSAPSGSGSAFSYYQAPSSALAPAAGGGGGSHLPRSLSQPPFFSMDSHSLTPLPYADPGAPGSEQAPSALPPRGPGHRRSRSDFLVGFSRPNPPLPVPPAVVDNAALDDIFGPYRVMGGALGSTVDGAEERRDHLRGPRAWSPADSSENEAESWAAGGGGRSPSNPRHGRSLSADSSMGSLNFGALGQDSPRLAMLPPAAGGSGSLPRTGSGPSGGPAALFATDLANAEFSEAERKKIMANDRLAEIALTDPKRVKRILANRVSAAKSKERKVKYMAELERRVHVLQMETTTLSAKVAREQRESDALRTQNNEMMIRLQALEQQALLKDALNEAMGAEVQRLKHAIGETSDPRVPNCSHQNMSRQMIQQQLLQLQKHPSEPQLAQQQQQQQ